MLLQQTKPSIYHNGMPGIDNFSLPLRHKFHGYHESEAISDLLARRNNNENFRVEVDILSNVAQQPDDLASLYSQPPEESQSGLFWQANLESLDCNFNGSSNIITIPSRQSHDNIFLKQLLVDDHASVNVTENSKRHASKIANILPRHNSSQHLMRHSNLQEQTMLRFHDHLNHKGMINSDKKVRRKQCAKMANKITALQKIVSPYGKTDTASVLHEASVFTKVLLKEIQILTGEEKSQKKQVDLQTKGLCLSPASIMHKFIEEESAALDRSCQLNK